MALALVLASAFLHAAWNALAKRARDPAWAVHVAVALSGVLAALVALVEVAGGARVLGTTAAAWSLFAGLFEARYFHALGRALAAGPLAPVYTLSRGAAVLLVWPLSLAFLGERLHASAALGTLLVLAGLFAAGQARGMSRAAVRSGFECALAIAGYHVGYKLALEAGGSPAAVFALSVGSATFWNLALGGAAFRADFARAARGASARTLLAGVMCATGFLLFMHALARGGAGWVFTLRNTSVLFATALAPFVGERVGRRQLVGAALVCAGAAALGWGR